jgi:hypothetical protein
MYLGLEEDADVIASYDTHWIPGLLQTEEYGAWMALLRDLHPAVASDPATTARLSEVRAERVARFAARGGQQCRVIDEVVLRRTFLSEAMRRAQLTSLLEVASSPGVTVRIRMLTAGPPVTPVGFSILRFADPLRPDVVCTEQLTEASYLDRPADVSRYAAKLDHLVRTSAPAEQTPAILQRMLAESN